MMAMILAAELTMGVESIGAKGGGEVEWIAHRGESADAPENTLAAFRLAWERGVKAVELDIHLALDGELVVIHDPDTERTTGVARKVAESRLDDLDGLDAGSWKAPEFAGEPIPTLSRALATIPDDGRLIIEVKVGPEAVPALVEAIEASGKAPERLAIISFVPETVAEAKRRLPDVPAYFLSGFRKDEETGAWTPEPSDLIARAKSLGADGLDLAARGPIDAAFVRQVHDAGLSLHVWTVDDLDEARRFVEAGVDGITTNRAAWMAEALDGSRTRGQ